MTRLAHATICNLTLLTILSAGCVDAAAQDFSQPGPYAPGWTEVSVTRPGGGSFTAVLYYPATTAGEDTPFDDMGAPYPGISFGHGFFQSVEKYQSTLEHLATWGFVVIASRSQGGLLPSHSQFAIDLSACLTYLEDQNADAGSPLYQAIATDRFGMSGHSMGGGASILATADDPRVRALANLAAAETNPSAVAAMANVDVPLRLIVGDEDTIVPIGDHTGLMYAAASAPRQMPVIQGGFHCGFIDSYTIFCDSGSISRAEQLATTRRLLTSFFELYLKGNAVVWSQVWGPAYFADDALDASSSDAGLSLMPTTQAIEGRASDTATTTLALTNDTLAATGFTLYVGDCNWPTNVTPIQTAVLAPGETAVIDIEVAIPPTGPASDIATISAQCDVDGGTRAYATLTTQRRPVGDTDCDGDIDYFDIDPFLVALSGPDAYAQAYPECEWNHADCDEDGDVDYFDVQAFLTLLGN